MRTTLYQTQVTRIEECIWVMTGHNSSHLVLRPAIVVEADHCHNCLIHVPTLPIFRITILPLRILAKVLDRLLPVQCFPVQRFQTRPQHLRQLYPVPSRSTRLPSHLYLVQGRRWSLCLLLLSQLFRMCVHHPLASRLMSPPPSLSLQGSPSRHPQACLS